MSSKTFQGAKCSHPRGVGSALDIGITTKNSEDPNIHPSQLSSSCPALFCCSSLLAYPSGWHHYPKHQGRPSLKPGAASLQGHQCQRAQLPSQGHKIDQPSFKPPAKEDTKSDARLSRWYISIFPLTDSCGTGLDCLEWLYPVLVSYSNCQGPTPLTYVSWSLVRHQSRFLVSG